MSPARRCPHPVRTALGAALLLLLAACGGGGGSNGPAAGPASCTLQEHQSWLAGYMDEWYFWYRQAPHPAASAFADIDSYFNALLYTGTDPAFPADRWSYWQTTEAYNRFFGDGQTLGYGVSVAGLEVVGDATAPLYVRHVEPQSPAAAQGVQRGDRVLSINGRAASELIAANDFAALTADQAGQTLTLVLRNAGGDRTVVLNSAVFALTPVTGSTTFSTGGGRKLAYVAVKDMISQALAPLDAAFAQFKAAGVNDLVLDLRYNGGGLVSTGATLASYVAGMRAQGLDYARLLYNDKRAGSNNQSFGFQTPGAALGLPRVFVLMGRRTCSASEQVINGLRGAGIEVVAVGETSCGKPVGFLPASACGRTYSVVNFESVNQRGEGRYFTGFAATCAVAENFTAATGSSGDPLAQAAAYYADNGRCPPAPSVTGGARGSAAAAGPGMVAR
jgi:hypothetical protein